MGEILADAAAQRERHRRRGGDGGGADLVDDVGFQPADQFDRGVHNGTPGRKTFAHVVGNFRVERHQAAGEQKMRRRQRPDVGCGKRLLADLFPGRRGGGGPHSTLPRKQGREGRGIDRNARRQFDRQPVVRGLDLDPGEAVAEKILALAAVRGLGQGLQRSEMHALAGAMHRRQPQHVMGMRHRRGVSAGRRLPHVVDHASASHAKSERSLLVR
jgi:hypothetical protein